LTTVLLQEIERYNKLLAKMGSSLALIMKAIKGLVIMSPELDLMYSALLKNQVPPNWSEVAYPSLKPLASWIRDLNQRVEFMRNWLKNGHPSCYWLSGFFFPHGFMTGTLQTFARRHQKAIDLLHFKFTVMQ
jgi:dynein heavy chain